MPERFLGEQVEILLNQERRISEPEVVHKIRQSLDYMMQHVDKPLHVIELAGVANISASHYFLLFKKMIGCAPICFFTRLKITCACEFLDATSFSVKETAGKLGYDDPFYFSRVFKSMAGVSPKNYRQLTEESRGAIKATIWENVSFFQLKRDVREEEPSDEGSFKNEFYRSERVDLIGENSRCVNC